MRRKLAAILIVAAGLTFLVYRFAPGVGATVDNALVNTVGPTVVNAFTGFSQSVQAHPIWVRYDIYIVGIPLFIVGLFVHRLWVSGRLRIRRWSLKGAAKDYGGAMPSANVPTTPVPVTPTVSPSPPETPTPTSPAPAEKEEAP